MSPTSDNLHEYLIGILECKGPTAAKDRMALRHQWKRARHLANDRDVSTEVRQSTATVSERAAEWSALEEIWHGYANLPPDASGVLQPWLNSTWLDVRNAAVMILKVCRRREQLAALWPKTLDQPQFDRFIAILIRPVTRRQVLQQSLYADLQTSPTAVRAFQQFTRRSRQDFPELEVPDVVAEHNKTSPPLNITVSHKPLIKPAAPEQNSKPHYQTVYIIAGIILLKIIAALSSYH